ncbi:MAG: haloacid dehalogenase-like hydrolase, partial [Clostridia bacterium]|nr:haloacid dehalogenase-like hydrolase [Clostridia bacterium]
STDDMQAFGFIQNMGMEVDDFWNLCGEFSKSQQAENILSYMYITLKTAKERGIKLTKEYFAECGKGVKFFDGVETWFDRINEYGKKLGVTIEHYVVSSGLTQIIKGTKIAKHFKVIYACDYVYENGEPIWPALSLNYTNKTQFLYRINKGCFDVLDRAVNEEMPYDQRPMPFANMIYIGDSATDIPSMRMIVKSGGTAIGLYQPKTFNEKYLRDLLRRDRISFVAKADYTQNSEFDIVIKEIINKIKYQNTLDEIRQKQKDVKDN